ncbi:hypothetical protein R3F64_19100, partial [Halomonas sp. 5021]|uniref:hypothetical protein n=1 Tax=Halomonas sp. 5021 TaxID=3082156 RepID=UPI002FC6DF5F
MTAASHRSISRKSWQEVALPTYKEATLRFGGQSLHAVGSSSQNEPIEFADAREVSDNSAFLFTFSSEEHPMPSRFELANAIRALSMDAVQKAKSGHPG